VAGSAAAFPAKKPIRSGQLVLVLGTLIFSPSMGTSDV
jgi:hypothetical protein